MTCINRLNTLRKERSKARDNAEKITVSIKGSCTKKDMGTKIRAAMASQTDTNAGINTSITAKTANNIPHSSIVSPF